jgi:hypothetical protein
MHQVAVPTLAKSLRALSGVLAKGAADAEARKIDPQVFLTARLAPDMFTLTRQVQIATDMIKGGIGRLSGVDVPKYEDTEASFAELHARIEKTLAFIESVSAETIDGTEAKPITITVAKQDMHFTGQVYLLHWVLPNVFFHITTAYDILRHNGVAIGKRDFLGGV